MIPSLETDHSRHLLLFVCYKNNYDNNMAMVPSFLPSITFLTHSIVIIVAFQYMTQRTVPAHW